MPKYFTTPTYDVAMNPKCGSSSICRRIIQVFYPELEAQILSAAYPDNRGPDDVQWHGMCPNTRIPTNPVVVIVRDPVDRFLSGIAYLNVTVEDAIDSLQTGSLVRIRRTMQPLLENVHFKPQHRLMSGATHLFRFADHFPQAHTFLGLGTPLALNQTSSPKPSITAQQRSVIESIYADDILLYDQITAPNTIVNAPQVSGALEVGDE